MSERIIDEQDRIIVAIAHERDRYKELFDAGCKHWQPVYQNMESQRNELQARVAELETLVKRAYIAGYGAGWNGRLLEDEAWENSIVRAELEGK